MTEQEIFNTAYTTLRDRGFTRAGRKSPSAGFICRYRSSIGPCAIGACITDEEYVPEMDNGTLSFLDIVASSTTLRNAPTALLIQLQNCHDFGEAPEEMKLRLENFAKKYNLTIPE